MNRLALKTGSTMVFFNTDSSAKGKTNKDHQNQTLCPSLVSHCIISFLVQFSSHLLRAGFSYYCRRSWNIACSLDPRHQCDKMLHYTGVQYSVAQGQREINYIIFSLNMGIKKYYFFKYIQCNVPWAFT